MGSFSKLVVEVGKWSHDNFGNNDGLNEVGPILGLAEELLDELPRAETVSQQLDAFADAMIFLADAFYRSGSSSVNIDFEANVKCGHDYLVQCIGQVSKSALKNRQGIRGVNGWYVENNLRGLFLAIVGYYKKAVLDGPPLADVVWRTWEEVRRRNWRENPENAHEVAS